MNLIFGNFKGWSWIVCLLLGAGGLQAQGYVGTIRNDKAFIIVSVPGNQSVEEIARTWGIPVAELLAENPGLTPGSIPPATELFVPVGMLIKTTSCDSCKPVYHHVAKSEGLYRIGKCYGNTSAATLKKMNQLSSDALKLDQELLVGYVAIQTNGSAGPVANPAMVSPEATIPVPENPAPVVPVKEPAVVVPRPELIYQGDGVFESEFAPDSAQMARRQGKAASFKSESGWKDGRFYLLNSQLKTGVVVKVSHPVSGKSIYAKVVGPLPVIKQNDKLDWRLSSAASAALGVWNEEEIMDLVIEY